MTAWLYASAITAYRCVQVRITMPHLFIEFEQTVEHFRRALFGHPIRIALMDHLDSLIAVGKRLVDARAAADSRAATAEARAEKAEGDLSAAQSRIAELQQQIAADDQKAAEAAADLQAEVDRETATGSQDGHDTVSGAEGNDEVKSGEVEGHAV